MCCNSKFMFYQMAKDVRNEQFLFERTVSILRRSELMIILSSNTADHLSLMEAHLSQEKKEKKT